MAPRRDAAAESLPEPDPDFREPEVAFGRSVRERRQERGWSQQELAERMGAVGHPVHQTTVAKLEAAERPLRVAEAAMLAGLFDTTLSDMLGLAGVGAADPLSRARARIADAERRWTTARLQALDVAQELAESRARVESLVSYLAEVEQWREQALDELHAARVALVEAEMEADRG